MDLSYILQSNSASTPQLFFILILVPTSIIFLFQLIKHKKPTSKLPPGPKKLPIIGNLHQIGDVPHHSFQLLYKEYGPILFLQLGSIPALVISSARIAKELFKNHDLVFASRPKLYAADKITYGCCDIVFAPYGEYWKEVKKIVSLELLSTKRVQSYEAVRDEEVQLMLDHIYQNFASSAINLSDITLLLANDVVCRVAFGKKYESGSNEEGGRTFHDMLLETEELLGGFSVVDFFPWMSWLNKFNGFDKRLDKSFNELDKFYDGVIRDHLDKNWSKNTANSEEDLVDVLLRIQKDPSQAIALTNENIKAVLTDMFFAGTDTSSATLEWGMAELIRNPIAMRKAQEEVREIHKNNKGKIKESDASQLVYLKLVIKETLRLHPPAPLLVPHETTEISTLNGYEIPAKTRVFIDAKAIARDVEWWEDAEEFRPERFLNSDIDYKGQNYEYLPFGSGRRICPAVNFSMVLMQLALANLLYNFEWELPEGMRREDVDMEESFGIAMHKKTPLCLVAKPYKLNV